MGRWGGKQEADSLKQISVWFLNKNKFFEKGWKSGTITFSKNGRETGNIWIASSINEDNPHLKLNYTATDNYTGEKKDFDYEIPLTTTPCYFGGKRYWFVCPWYANGTYCGKRVGVLYLGGDYFACRHCYDLTYETRNLSGIYKRAGKVISIPELEEMEAGIKRKYYAGKMTKKYLRYLKKRDKSLQQLMIVADNLKRKRASQPYNT